MESIKFCQIKQLQGESIENFALRFRKDSAHWDYGTLLDQTLIEQLLYGIKSKEMYDEINESNSKTFKKAYEVAQVLEATRQT